ncbi:hypothetical protein ABMA27_011680 [Loxostege sticticalis]|uniref:Uncharacterized protein n=1 Tax=Loxostege sticticalis TaxID=481309 RepID=A0ABR3IH74_LOXSC
MKSLFIVLEAVSLVLVVYGIDTTPKNTLEESLLSLLTQWRAGDRGPFSFPFPSLDEIKIPAVSGNYEGYGAKISYETTELKLVGLKNFSVASLDASEASLKASGTITIPVLTLSADKYTIQGRALWFIPVNGSGKMRIDFGNNQLTFSIRLRSNSSSTWVDTLQLAFSVGSLKASLENGPAAITTILNNSGVSIIQSNHDAIVKMVRNLILPVINNFLAGLTPEQLLQTIAGNGTIAPNAVRV